MLNLQKGSRFCRVCTNYSNGNFKKISPAFFYCVQSYAERATSKLEKRLHDTAEVAIIGGGALGVGLAYHLSKQGLKDVVLLEKSELTAGSTWHAAGLSTYFIPTIRPKRLNYESLKLYATLEKETGQDIGFHTPGTIRLADTPERMDEFRYQMQRAGWNDAPQKLLNQDEVAKLHPLLNMDKILGGLYNPGDGYVDPYSLTMALAIGARTHGAEIYQQCPVTGIRPREDGTWEVDVPKGTLKARKLVNAAGFWAREIGKMVGVDHPLVPVDHQYVVTKPIPELEARETEIPVIRDLRGSYYCRQEKKGLLVGPYEAEDKMRLVEDWYINGPPPGFGMELFPRDLDRISDNLDIAMDLLPVLEKTEIQTVVSGPIMYNPDVGGLVGQFRGLRNYYVSIGVLGGIIQTGSLGKYLSDWIITGEPPYELIDYDPNRFSWWADQKYVFSKVREGYGRNNAIIYPRDERPAGRPTARVSGVHELLLEKGAEMGFHSGWEQPNWFALPGDDAGYKPSFRRTNWFEPVGRECEMVLTKAGIIDLTPFGKFEVEGTDARKLMDRLVANTLPKVGRTNISHMLTSRGTVYAELSVTACSPDLFFCVTGSGSELHDIRWVEQKATEWDYNVKITNVTDDIACLGVTGPRSRDIIQELTNEDMGDGFHFRSMRQIVVDGMPVKALRISYTGELGFELYHTPSDTLKLYNALWRVGEKFGMGNFGTYAMNVLRIEKGFQAWGNEMTVDLNPFEAGLGSFIRMDKPADFIGKEALKNIKSNPLKRKLVMLAVDTKDVDPEGNESVWHQDQVIGMTTSGCYSYQFKQGLAMAYVPIALSNTGSQVDVELLGDRRSAVVLAAPPAKTERARKTV